MSIAYDWVVQFPLTWRREAPVEAPSRIERDDLRALRASLEGVLARKVTTGTALREEQERRAHPFFLTGVTPLDSLLGGGLKKGTLTELVSRRSCGRFATTLATIATATQIGEAVGLVDVGDGLDPQSATLSRVELARVLWVRPRTLKHAVMASEMLITTGFPLVVLDLGMQLRGRRPHEAAWVRLVRAAEKHNAALLVSTPFSVSGTASDAVVKIERSRPIWKGRGNSPRLLAGFESTLVLEKHRGGRRPGTTTEMRLQTGDVR